MFHNTYSANNMRVERIPLNFTPNYKLLVKTEECKVYPSSAKLWFQLLDFEDYKVDKAKKYKFYQQRVIDGDSVAIYGETSENTVQVSMIGDKDRVYDSVRTDEFGFCYPRLFFGSAATLLAATLLVGVIILENPTYNY